MARTIDIEYKFDLPAWRLKIVQPNRFEDVKITLTLRLFKMPQGALLGILLKLYDVPDQPYFAHRVMDLSDDRVTRHAGMCAAEGRIVVVFAPMGEQPGFDRTVDLDRDAWNAALKDGRAYNKTVSLEPDAALDQFLKAFEPVSQDKGVEAGWAEVERRLIP